MPQEPNQTWYFPILLTVNGEFCEQNKYHLNGFGHNSNFGIVMYASLILFV